jgi:hypothetical protein
MDEAWKEFGGWRRVEGGMWSLNVVVGTSFFFFLSGALPLIFSDLYK